MFTGFLGLHGDVVDAGGHIGKAIGQGKQQVLFAVVFQHVSGGGGQLAFGGYLRGNLRTIGYGTQAIFFLVQLQFHGQLEFVAFVLKSIEDRPVHQSAVGFAEVGGINAV